MNPKNFSKQFMEQTIKIWRPYSSTPLTEEDTREIAENMTKLFSLLNELDRKYGKEEKDGKE